MTDPASDSGPAFSKLKRLGLAGTIPLGFSLLTLGHLITEYGTKLKDMSDGNLKDVCSISEDSMQELFISTLVGCHTRYVTIPTPIVGGQTVITTRYFNDPCEIAHGVVDHVDCSGFYGLTMVFKLPEAVLFAVSQLYWESGIIGLVIVFAMPLTLLAWAALRAVSERIESVGGFPNRLISASSFTLREWGRRGWVFPTIFASAWLRRWSWAGCRAIRRPRISK